MTDESNSDKDNDVLLEDDEKEWVRIEKKTLKNFNLNDLIINKEGYFDTSITIFGARRTGKSTLLLDILTFLQKNKKIGRIAVITSTEMNKFFKKHLPDATIFTTDNIENTIDNILAFQKYIIEEEVDDGIIPQYTLILDDFSWMRSFSIYNEKFAQVFTTGRHYNMAVIILVQSPTGAMNWVRSNSDFVFVLHTQGGREKERLWVDHMSFLQRNEYVNFIDSNTMNYNAIVVNKSDPYQFGNDTIFKFKSKNIDISNVENRMKFGDPKWRQKIERKKEVKKKKNPLQSNIDFESMNTIWKRSGFSGAEFKDYIINV